MHFLIVFAIALFMLWILKEAVVRRFKRPAKYRPAKPLPVPAMVQTVALATRANHRPAFYVIGGLLAMGLIWLIAPHASPGLLDPKKTEKKEGFATSEVSIPEIPDPKKAEKREGFATSEVSASTMPLTTVLPNPRASADAGCEWVNEFTRQDGTFVQSHWSSKPGHQCSLLEPEPTPVSHERSPIYTGPRRGQYHYSKSGNKVYEHRRH